MRRGLASVCLLALVAAVALSACQRTGPSCGSPEFFFPFLYVDMPVPTLHQDPIRYGVPVPLSEIPDVVLDRTRSVNASMIVTHAFKVSLREGDVRYRLLVSADGKRYQLWILEDGTWCGVGWRELGPADGA